MAVMSVLNTVHKNSCSSIFLEFSIWLYPANFTVDKVEGSGPEMWLQLFHVFWRLYM